MNLNSLFKIKFILSRFSYLDIAEGKRIQSKERGPLKVSIIRNYILHC